MAKIEQGPIREGDGPARVGLELFTQGAWHRVGTVKVEDPRGGVRSPGSFEYDVDYLDRFPRALGARDARAVSCRYAVGYEPFEDPHWPPFLLDIIPSGAARRHWEGRLGLPNTESSDWSVLRAAGHPPGNLRVASGLDLSEGPSGHPGFPRSDILERAEDFIEYAHRSGAPVSGSSGAGGDSPKFLLREDHEGRWHADGALPDDRTRGCWLVKFPRTRDASDRRILEAEAAYHRVAGRFGARTLGEVTWERDCLFVPRFDRKVHAGKVDRFGLESLCSLAGVAEFGAALPKEGLARALATHATEPPTELREFVLRDVLDVALGNTDNHARNTSVLKDTDGRVALSPIYDFAPMFLDARGIARVCRWADRSDLPNWNVVVAALVELGLDPRETKSWLRGLADRVAALPGTLRDCAVPDAVTTRCEDRIVRVARALAEVTP
jgi:serine/threonine-protein kinase HipA